MKASIVEILQENIVDGACHSHVSMINPTGKFNFTRQKIDIFWDRYCDAVKSDCVMGLAEKSQNYMPVLVDIDLKMVEEDDAILGSSLYTMDNVIKIIGIYQSVLRNIVDECTDKDLIFVVLEKPMYRITKGDKTYVKNGLHLQAPNLFLSKSAQMSQLIPRVKQIISDAHIFEDIGIEDSGSVIDDAVCRNPWLLYCSRKSEEMQPYKVTKIYDSDRREISLEQAFDHYKIFDIRENIINVKGKIEYYLPRILSIIPFGRDTKELRSGLISPIKEKMKLVESKKDKIYEKVSINENLKICERLIPMIANHRAEERNEWMSVGWVLYNIGDGCEEALNLWIEFSRRAEESFDEERCIAEWSKMYKKDCTIGTIKWYASVDSPDKYKEYVLDELKKYTKSSISGSHNDLAKVLYAEWGNEFVCASVISKEWYQFKDHKWELIEDGTFLRAKISNELFEKIKEIGKDLYDKVDSEADMTQHSKQTAMLNRLLQNLRCAPFKNNIMREAMEVFYDKRFLKKLNMDPHLIAFTNGVYELKTDKFRPGRPEDYICKCMPFEYTEFSETDDRVIFVRRFFEQIFPDKSLLKYFLDRVCSVFVGGNHEKIGLFWTGEGDNGKTVMQTFFEKMLGPYAVKLPTTVLTGKKPSSGSAFAELARTGDGVRWATAEEPNGDEEINSGAFKNFTGNDTYTARDLFQRGKDVKEIIPLYKLVVICNKLPRFKYADKATFNRVRVIPFESKFCRPNDPAPETYAEQLRQKRFPMDPNFAQKIPELLPIFCWILIEHRKHFTVTPEPEKVRMATERYMLQNDTFRQFIDENIISDEKSSVSLLEINTIFKEWFKESFNGQSAPNKSEVKDYFSKLWDEPIRGRWNGHRIKTLQDELATGEAIEMTEDDFASYDEDTK